MELDETIFDRRSIRRFKDTKIPKEYIKSIINSGQWAPSACNKQLNHFIVVDNPQIKSMLVEKAGSIPLIKRAPVIIVITYNSQFSFGKNNANLQSASAAIQNMLLKAYSLGLGSVWLSSMGDKEKVKKILEIPKHYNLASFLALGYPDEQPIAPERKKVEEVCSYNNFKISNKFDYPNTYNPKKWNLIQIAEYKNNSLRATSPTKDCYTYRFRNELDLEIKTFANWIKKEDKNLEILPFAGTHCLNLLKKYDVNNYHILEFLNNSINFIKTRKKIIGIDKEINYYTNKKLDLPKELFDNILIFQTLETLPKRIELLTKINKSLNKEGQLIISFRSKLSWFYLFYLYDYVIKNKAKLKDVWNYGPFKPLLYSNLKKELNKTGFKVVKRVSLSLFPFTGKTFLKSFGRLQILRCKKIR
jgi:nitroreductase